MGSKINTHFTKASVGTGLVIPQVETTADLTDFQIWKDSSDDLFWYDGTSSVKLNSTGGGGGGGTLDEAYENGQSITVDSGPMALVDASTGASDTFTIVKSGTGSGDLVSLSADAAMTGNAIAIDMNLGITAVGIFIDNGGTARTGSDISVTDDSTGTHSVISIASSGSGASTGFDWTDSFNGNDASFGVKLTLDNGDGIDATAIQIVRGTGTRTAPAIDINETSTGSADVIDIDVSGVYTGDILSIVTSAAATGNMIFVNLDSGVAATALHIEGSGVRTQPFVEVSSDATGSSNMVTFAPSGATWSGHVIQALMTAATTGDVINIDMDAAVGGKAIVVDSGGGTRTVALVDITHDGDGNADCFNFTHTNTGSGHMMDINVSGVGSGNVIDIVYSAASTGDAIRVNMGSNLAGNALQIDASGTRTAPLIYIANTGTDAGTDDHVLFIDQSGLLDSNLVQLTFGTAASTGNALAIAMDTNVAGMAISVVSAGTGVSGEGVGLDMVHTGNLTAGADLVRLDSTGNISSTSNVLSIVQRTGAGTTGAYAVHISATGTNVEALKVDDGNVVFDELLTVTGLVTLTAGIDAKVILAGIEDIAAGNPGVLDLTKTVHTVGADAGGDTFTLANGTAGQIMYIICEDATGTSTITPATFGGGTSVTFNAVGDSVALMYTAGTGWNIVGGNSYTVI